tara:strand:- start:15426 stop:15635 length:210 start_codon:yes stop_codon:yes gene_type:complete
MMATKSKSGFILMRILILLCDAKNKSTAVIAYQKKSIRNSSEAHKCFTSIVMPVLHEFILWKQALVNSS